MGNIKPSSGTDDRIPLASMVPLSEPYALYIYPTNRCNFRCSYCVHSLGRETLLTEYGIDNNDMSFETFRKAVDGLAGMTEPLKTIVFVGQGEPLLNRDLARMIAYAKERKITRRTEIITNASLLKRELSDALLDSGLDVLRISLQGMSAESYKRVCGCSIDYQLFLDQITYFYKRRGNCRLFVKVVDEALSEGEDSVFYDTFGAISDRMFIERIKPVYKGVEYKESADSVVTDRYGNNHPPRFVCPLPFYMITVWPDGSVAPCEAIYKPITLGNVNNEKLLDLWRGEAIREFWRMQLIHGKNHFARCRECCAPDDVSHPMDVLDNNRTEIFTRIQRGLT